MRSSANRTSAFASWNRRLHYFSGLFLLFFLWLFALTGLLLNHPQWTFAEFWPSRTQTTSTRAIQSPPPGSDLAQARNVMHQLGVHGEIEWTKTRADRARLEFRASRPGRILEIAADFNQNSVRVLEIGLNAWGVSRLLHTFTGVRAGNPANERDWVMATIWALSMDAVALGTILLVLSSLYMWWRLPEKRRPGLIAFGLGLLCCGYFVLGLRLLY